MSKHNNLSKLTTEQRRENGRKGAAAAKAKRAGIFGMTAEERKAAGAKGGKVAQTNGNGRRWSAEEARARGAEGAKACADAGTHYTFSDEDRAKAREAYPGFTSDSARVASGQHHDRAFAEKHPDAEWAEGCKPGELATPAVQ